MSQEERFVELINGVDISRYQGKINWELLKQPDGFPENLFCMVKAGGAYTFQGTYKDPNFDVNAEKAAETFDYVSHYWFFVPRGGVEFAKKQARIFWLLVKDKKWNWLAVDVESQPWGYKVSPSVFQTNLKAFLEELSLLSEGAKAWIYTRDTFWYPNVGSPPWAEEYPLHVARYHDYLLSPWGDGYYKILPWAKNRSNEDWTDVIWQHSADYNNLGEAFGVESDDIDRNAFKGTRESFEYMLRRYGNFEEGEVEPPIDPPIDPDPNDDIVSYEKIVRTTTNLNIRAGSGTDTADIGTLMQGTDVPVVKQDGDWYKIEGWIHKNYTRDI